MLNDGRLISPIVSVEWLHNNLYLENLVLLYARVPNKVSVNDILRHIPESRVIDVKKDLSDTSQPFPNTIGTADQLQKVLRNLGINKDSIVVVYDDKGVYWSPRVWWLFKTFGFNNIAVLDGGLPEWIDNGFATSTSAGAVSWNLGDFSVDYQEENMCFFDDIQYSVTDPNTQIIDARSEDRFNCKVKEPRYGLRSGTIPNSLNLHYKHLLNGNCLKPKSELKTIFDTFNLSEKSVIFSCGSGITACIVALGAIISGLDNVQVYDGSWTEYGSLIN